MFLKIYIENENIKIINNLEMNEKVVKTLNWIINFKNEFILQLKQHLRNFKNNINKFLEMIYDAFKKLPRNLIDGVYNILFIKNDKNHFMVTFKLKGINLTPIKLETKSFNHSNFSYDENKKELEIKN